MSLFRDNNDDDSFARVNNRAGGGVGTLPPARMRVPLTAWRRAVAGEVVKRLTQKEIVRLVAFLLEDMDLVSGDQAVGLLIGVASEHDNPAACLSGVDGRHGRDGGLSS